MQAGAGCAQEGSTSADTSRTERGESAHTVRGRRYLLSHFLLPYILRRGETCKEGFGGFTVRNLLNKTMPLIHPIVAATTLTLFFPTDTRDGEITRFMPSQGTSQGLPETRIEERLFHGNHKSGCVIFSRPCREFAVCSLIGGFCPVRPVNVVPAFCGFFERLCDGHVCAPLSLREHGGKVSHIEPVSQDDSIGA